MESKAVPGPSWMKVGGRSGYLFLAAFLAAWLAIVIYASVNFIADLYFYSYYSVDYSLGFVRRGLAGELLNVFPSEQYFNGLRILRWIPTLLYSLGLAVVAWTAAVRWGLSERRLMLALLVPVLPFGVVFAMVSARPDVLGGAALAAFAVSVALFSGSRALTTAAAIYGLTTVPLTLMHEATPFLYGLGAVAVIVTLGRRSSIRTQRLSMLLALVPGLLTGLAVAAFGRRGISAGLCDAVPHGLVNHPLAGNPTPGQVISGFTYYVDYHDWFCRSIVPYFDQGFGDAAGFVASRGVVLLGSSALFGLCVFAIAMSAISHVSGVRVAEFAGLLRESSWWVAAATILFLPVFVTGVDWTRWFVTMSFDLGIPYLLYASSRPEAAIPPTRRTFVVFVVGVILLAVFPIGLVPGFAGTLPE